MGRPVSLDEVVRRQIDRPDHLENAEAVMELVDEFTRALRHGEVRAKCLAFPEALVRWQKRDLSRRFWAEHQFDLMEYLCSGRGLIQNVWWEIEPSFSDVMFHSGDVWRWELRVRWARFWRGLIPHRALPALNRRAMKERIDEAFARAVERRLTATTVPQLVQPPQETADDPQKA